MTIQPIRVSEIEGSPYQPRQVFPERELAELAASIKADGQLQPVLVRPVQRGQVRFQLIAGQRRWEAHKLLGWDSINAVVSPMGDLQAAVTAGVENIQRAGLTGYEEYEWLLNVARLYEKEHGQPPTQIRLARLSSQHVNWVRNRLQIAAYKPDVLALTRNHAGVISSAAEINKITDKEQRAGLIKLVEEGASFTEVKSSIETARRQRQASAGSRKAPDAFTQRAINSGPLPASRGREVTGTPRSEARAAVDELAVAITGKIMALESYAGSVDQAHFAANIAPQIKRWRQTLAKMEAKMEEGR